MRGLTAFGAYRHAPAARDSVAAAVEWIVARFAGGAAPNDCAR